MIARIFRIFLVIILLFVSWISTGFFKLVKENGISFYKFEEHIAKADVSGGAAGALALGEDGFEDGLGVIGADTGPGPAGEGPGAGESGIN